jgi:hypothetical protein
MVRPNDAMLATAAGFILELELAYDRPDLRDRNLIGAAQAFEHVKHRLQFASPHLRRHLFAEALKFQRKFLRGPATSLS